MNVDFIIVGQGLAGTLLAHELYRQNSTFVVFDDPDQPKASEVAAGLINPVVFRRMTKSWLADDAFPQMETTYRQLEDLLNAKLYYPGRMLRILNQDETDLWTEKALTNKLETYLDAEPDLNFRNKNITTAYSFGCVNKSGRLDIQKLIFAFSEFLRRGNLIRKEKFDLPNLTFNNNSLKYNDLTAQKIIFCEGAAISENPYFSHLKFKHSKGEILELKIPEIKLDEIISHNIFIIPIGKDTYRVGATYSWDELNWETTDSAREELLAKLTICVAAPSETINQKAGIRPTMHDRKPVIGFHPDYPQIGIFNGLGPKGVLLGPYFARQLAGNLTGISTGISTQIHPEVNIERYFRTK